MRRSFATAHFPWSDRPEARSDRHTARGEFDSVRACFSGALAPTATGCVTRLDMASAYDAGRPATTIPYASVRGSRQFADYEAIGGSILTGASPATSAQPKAAKPKGASK